MWTQLVLLVLSASAVMSYRMQSPVIEVCPQALRVSIADSTGVQLFAFHGNINHPIGETEAGHLSRDINRKTSGRWVYETTMETFNLGDTINYWIYVQHRGLGYRSDVMKHTVNAFSNKCEAYETDSSEEVQVDSQKYGRKRTKGPNGVCHCEQEIRAANEKVNETRKKLEKAINETRRMQDDFEALNDVLGEVLEKLNYGRKLLLTGVIPPGDNPYDLIRTILSDKLDLNDLKTKLLNASTTVHGAILFEMTSSADKLRILLRAKRLDRSKMRIINYQDEDNEIINISSPTSILDGPDPAIDVRFGAN
uniref:Putative beta-13-glucan-binding protein 2 n=2 Tax=Nyssomyia neivai TaxID=330878 RepID=A0A1L8E3E8_9DIPT